MRNTCYWPNLWDGKKYWTKRNIKLWMLTWMMSLNWPNTCPWLNIWNIARYLSCLERKAIEKELQQIQDTEGFQPKHWYELTKERQTKALKYHMYPKERRDGRIKGRGCTDRWLQWEYTKKIDTSLPTALMATMMPTCMIDAFERRDIITVNRRPVKSPLRKTRKKKLKKKRVN